MSELLWIAVPSGLRPSSKAAIRVLVVPRLTTVDIGEAGLGDWPATLAEEVSFTMRTSTSVGEKIAIHRPELVSEPSSQVWSGFFSGDAGLVNEYQPKTNPAPNVAPTHQDGVKAAQTYRSVTRAAADPAVDANAAIRTALTTWAAPEPPLPPADSEPPVFTIPDFHATVSTLREHPTVLLQLGLVFELLVDTADLNLGDAADRRLSIRCTDPPFLANEPPSHGLITSPWSRYNLTANDFRPEAAPGSEFGIRNGVLDLSGTASLSTPASQATPPRWAIATFDIDGAVGSLRQTGREIAAGQQETATMPPIRSAGFALVRPNRHGDFTTRARTAGHRAAASMADTVLAAEDLILGYRVDIRRGEDPWLSVCERKPDYKINDVPIEVTDSADGLEEGHVKAFPAVKDAQGALHSDEIVLRWDGWNLALPLPNLRADTAEPVRNPDHQLPYRFDFSFGVPTGRLPALRFGESYQMRIRVADLTGGGLRLGDVESEGPETSSITYRRHDPIQPPQLGATGTFPAGAAVDRLVIRSDKDMTPEQLHAADPDYPLTESRTLDPPTASLQLIEQHRMLDGLTDERSFQLAQRAMLSDAAGSGLPDPVVEGIMAFVPQEDGGSPADITARTSWSPPGTPRWPDQRPKRIELSAQTNQPQSIAIKWITADPADSVTEVLKITLAKGEQATIELSSTIVRQMEEHLAMKEHLSGSPDQSVDESLLENTKIGRNPVVTPPRRILAVHAVRRPLAEPRWTTPLVVERVAGDTFALLKPMFTTVDPGAGLNPDSTGRLDVAASWTEFEDNAEEAGPGKRQVTVEHLHTQSIARTSAPTIELPFRHEFGDTKYRRVTYTLNATSRFREYFKPSEPESSFQLSRGQDHVDILSSARPPAPVVVGVVPAFRWERTQPGGDRIEHVRHSRRLRVELTRPWFCTGEGEQLAVILAPDNAGAATGADFVTRLGRDPLFGTPATPPRPNADWFLNAAAPAMQFTLEEFGVPVVVVPFDVAPGGDRWYADIEFGAAAQQFYNPFVQLAVARYQRDTVAGLSPISTVVSTDSVPMLPDRHVVVTRAGNQIIISVDGTSPNPLNRLEAVLETCPQGIPPETLDAIVDDPAADPELPAWRPVAGGSVTRAASGTIPAVTLPVMPGPLRIRLCETEDRLTEPDDGAPQDLLRRNVFVDTIVLPTSWQPA